ncbi:MAG: hypothetical protein RIS25_1002 [Actinomycetota bacterium]|jgi:glutamyl-tRNA synthetase
MDTPFTTATGSDIRVRFCPSPTGTPHVGLIRTALFNWAYARHVGGTFVFRIEDTDAERDSEESYEQLLDALSWLGLDWDEGVVKGGPHEPYRQSQRTDIYQDLISRLLATGHLYESYITPDEMEARNVAAGRDPKMGYDNSDRDLTDEQRAAHRAEGRQPALRLRVPDVELGFDDIVRGPIVFPRGATTDFVVVRPNGQPLYTFVNPVDDALMGITHVLRGEDLLSSTPRQIALYHALIEIGVTTFVPRFGHLPYVMGEGNKKLSKRDPESNLFHHRDRGFIREGLLNYLSLLGWSISHDRDVFTIDEMIAAFDVHDVNPNPARFDLKKADSINGDHIRLLPEPEFVERVLPYLQKAGLVSVPASSTQTATLIEVAPLVRERVTVLSEIPEMVRFLFVSGTDFDFAEDALAGLDSAAADVLAASHEALSALDTWSTASIEQALRDTLLDGLGLKPRSAFGAVRTAISGRRISPPLFESMEILGRQVSLDRIHLLRGKLI